MFTHVVGGETVDEQVAQPVYLLVGWKRVIACSSFSGGRSEIEWEYVRGIRGLLIIDDACMIVMYIFTLSED